MVIDYKIDFIKANAIDRALIAVMKKEKIVLQDENGEIYELRWNQDAETVEVVTVYNGREVVLTRGIPRVVGWMSTRALVEMEVSAYA